MAAVTQGNEIMRASAGSGKTFALSGAYIRLLLQGGRDAHRHILAVTFTNKATAEMKNRILEELFRLGYEPEKSGHLAILSKSIGVDEGEIQKRAREALNDILNDYGSFAVSTIDKFFQQVLRAFSREAGQFSEYRVELDKKALVNEAVDRVLDSLGEGDRSLLNWFSSNMKKDFEEGERSRIEAELREFAEKLFSPEFEKKARLSGSGLAEMASEEKLEELSKLCDSVIKNGRKTVAARVSEALSAADCYPEEFLNGFLVKFLRKSTDEIIDEAVKVQQEKKYWSNTLADASAALSAKGKKAGCDASALQTAVRNLDQTFTTQIPLLRTASQVKGQLPYMRAIKDLKAAFAEVLKDRNVLSLDDSSSILRDIINGTQTPFIYEKTGVRFNHFLLDEFQDTSGVQWENFLPLLRNISEGIPYNLLVGDVKQSIYRWRNADWEILQTRVKKDLMECTDRPLKTNWRSAPEIIGFNNRFFREYAEGLDLLYQSKGLGEAPVKVADIYSDVQQECRHTGYKGSVEVSFFNDRKERLFAETVEAVKDAMDRGFKACDIAILVRSNYMGGEIAKALSENDIDVISNDSLLLVFSGVIRTLVARMTILDTPDDPASIYQAGDFDPSAVNSGASLYELANNLLSGMDEAEVNEDSPYVLSFMDLIRDFVAREGNSLHAFLQFWNEEGFKKAISTPEGGNAVTVMTIHKAKGLAFPFVIVPVAHSTSYINKNSTCWETPSLGGTPLEAAGNGLYNVKVMGLDKTLFREAYAKELLYTYIDDINTWYVAFTRAKYALHVVCMAPGSNDDRKMNCFSDALQKYVPGICEGDGSSFTFGSHPVRQEECNPEEKVGKRQFDEVRLNYVIPGTRNGLQDKLLIHKDSVEFFGDGASRGNARMRGLVLHGIMERVRTEADLPASVRKAVMDGMLSREEGKVAEQMLAGAMEQVRDRGWFAPDAVSLDERDIADKDGSVYRPDRVVVKDGSACIIDYKTGEEEDSYVYQLRRYRRLYRELGYQK
ncbi:MAG: UvrD-helicase domain-containing protein, partial [Bacteroidales bacterium]|nr:UvrD-helicase domain-containing protein [Bacteroidales bacterium]